MQPCVFHTWVFQRVFLTTAHWLSVQECSSAAHADCVPERSPACWSGWLCMPCLSCARLQGAAALQQCPLPAIVLRNSAPRRACSAAVAFMERRALVAAATGLPMCGCNLAPGCDLAPAHSSPALQWRSWSECSGGCNYRSCKLGF